MSKTTRIVHLIILAIPTMALAMLAKWNYVQADDYIWPWLRKGNGFWGMQQWIYANNSGRYTASFLEALSTQDELLFRAPWLFPLLFIGAEILALFLLTRTVLKWSVMDALAISLFLFTAHIILTPEPSSALFSFSAASTYQISIILALFLACTLHQLVVTGSNTYLLLSAALVLIIGGTNELSALVLLLSCVFLAWELHKKGKLATSSLIVLAASALVALSFLFLAPGIHIRGSSMHAPDLSVTFASFVAWELFSIWNLFKEPVFWLMAFVVFLKAKHWHLDRLPGWKIIMGLVAIQFLSLGAVLHHTHGTIPIRLVNVYTTCHATLFLFIAVRLGIAFPGATQTNGILSDKIIVRAGLLMILFSGLSGNIVQSWLAAPYASTINELRISGIQVAHLQGKRYVELSSYEEMAELLLEQSSMRTKMRELAKKQPSLLYIPIQQGEATMFRHLIDENDMDSIRVGGELITRPSWAKPLPPSSNDK